MKSTCNSAIQPENNTPDLNQCPDLPFILAEPQAQLDEGSNYQVHIPEVPKYLLEPDDYPRTLSELDKYQMAQSKIDELTATNSLFKLVIVASTKIIHIGGKL